MGVRCAPSSANHDMKPHDAPALPDPSVIIARVKEEARSLAKDAVQEEATALSTEAAAPPEQNVSPPARERQRRLPTHPPSKDVYHRDELLLFHGEEFLREAYHAILRREIDEVGRRDYLAELERGQSRQAILIALLHSPEAKTHGVRVSGLTFARPCVRIWRSASARGMPRLAALARRALLADEARCARRVSGQVAVLTLQRALIDDVRLDIGDVQDDFRDGLNGLRDDFRRRLDGLVRNHGRLRLEFQEHREALKRELETAQRRLEETSAALSLARGDLLYHQAALNRLLRDLSEQGSAPSMQRVAAEHESGAIDAYYVAFEDANRGTTEEVRAKLSPYLDVLASAAAGFEGRPVCDIGCGRGEWLALLAEKGIAAYGIDTNPIMIDRVRGQGLDARHEDALAHLRAQPDGSLAAITGFHIVEHLPFDALFGLFEEARRVLMPGGLLIFETPNPENVLVGSHTFYHDFTHRNPVTPSALTFLARYHNFTDLRILRLNPYPEEARVPGTDALTERVNGHFCGPQDFSLVAAKPPG